MEAEQKDLGYKSCTKCNRTFKRLEHLKRHERIHDDTVRFACTQCPKVFTRSDILRRHEVAHIAAAQSHDGNAAAKRACLECAKARERCSKGEPCQRCSLRNLSCSYPQGRQNLANSESPLPFGHVAISPSNTFSQSSALDIQTSNYRAMSVASDHHTEYVAGPPGMPVNDHGDVSVTSLTPSGFENVDNMVDVASQMPTDFSLNWLPMDESISIDYDSILGMDINSLGLFPNSSLISGVQGPGLANDGSAYQLMPAFQSASHDSFHGINRMPPTSQQSPAWDTTPSQAATRSMSATSPGSTINTPASETTSVGLYATSTNGARMPCTKRSKRCKLQIPCATPMKSVTDPDCLIHFDDVDMGFPRTDHIMVDNVPTASPQPELTREMYEHLCKQHRRLCLEVNSTFTAFSTGHFPDHSALSLFIRLYFENFDSILPILHAQVADFNDHWPLALGICAIGCQYAESEEFSACVVPLHEMLRRAIIVELEQERRPERPELDKEIITLTQARILNYFGMVYFGHPELAKRAKAQHGALVELALSSGFLNPSLPAEIPEGIAIAESQDLAWRAAILAECKRRCGYTIWLLDCMAVYHFSQRPLMPPIATQCSLPDDLLWATKNPGQWITLWVKVRPALPSLSAAVVQIFTKKHVSADLDQLSRILLLHGVYREIFQLKDCFARPLSSWVPSMQLAADSANRLRNEPVPDPSWRSLLSSWRNASLDCVDVIHWAANATIAQQSGAEHPTVLHLHLARTILLAPFEEIQILCASIAAAAQDTVVGKHKLHSVQRALDAEREILNWAQRDQYKARLAVLHCGCLFWHLRRYSCRAFYEPISVFLATLTLWAYSSYTSRPNATNHRAETWSDDHDSNDHASAPTSPASDSEPMPKFIHLDRPNDDEMVQYFVLSGTPSTMRANITGVGDMYAPKGPTKILKEGRKILSSVSTAWGRTKEYVAMLESLERATSGQDTLQVDDLSM
ncbi:hypothetical protein T440DRAFT_506307 [Plenodomus tracheiphilus IPT5]|uniref:Uncharacterized protein n=1 Tax=Plenodomus tracheiphilus IPT5 TaxID=1408161 RepID=A0A6A7BBM9_9PLEO|nr:hypothetical protein T440DRAFT_506307 [Plenodomus tracheiphilus IPT5]